MISLPLGPLMVGVAGMELRRAETGLLLHPSIGGVILFTRNYAAPDQLRALVASIKALREPQLLVAVDHEGGRVQRFRDGFTRIPPMRELGALWDADHDGALALARSAGFVVAAELAAHGVDFSFAPVLDIDHGNSSVIGNRALHNHAAAVAELALALHAGLKEGGMIGVGKHFPGHGYAHADSHVELPVDERSFDVIEASDLVPFQRLIDAGLAAVMPAHVVYPAVDARAAGFSPVWLRDILRGRMGFKGAIISDDLGMEGASAAGGMVERAGAALSAGTDLILSGNDPAATALLMRHVGARAESQQRLADLRGPGASAGGVDGLRYRAAREAVERFAGAAAAAPILPGDIVGSL